MRSSLKVILPGVAAALVLPATALADPAISVDRPCYATPSQRPDTVRLMGTGFTPGGAYQVTLDGRPLTGGTGTADGTGAVAWSFTAPELAAGTREQAFSLGVQEGTHTASTTFSVAHLGASFRPSSGDPTRLRVTFELVGFGLSGRTAAPVYVHYVRPDGRPLDTVRLGTGSGPCGSLRPRLHRRLFPFRPTGGTWHLQFDSAKAYRKGRARSTFLFYTVTVKVRRATRSAVSGPLLP